MITFLHLTWRSRWCGKKGGRYQSCSGSWYEQFLILECGQPWYAVQARYLTPLIQIGAVCRVFFSNKYWRNSLQIMGSDSLLLNFCIHLKAIKNSRSIAQLDRLILSALDMVSHRRNGRRHPRCSHHPHASDLGFVWKMRVTLIIYSRACVLTVWLSPNSSMGHASSGLHPIRTTWSHARKSRIPTCCSWPCKSKLDT